MAVYRVSASQSVSQSPGVGRRVGGAACPLLSALLDSLGRNWSAPHCLPQQQPQPYNNCTAVTTGRSLASQTSTDW